MQMYCTLITLLVHFGCIGFGLGRLNKYGILQKSVNN